MRAPARPALIATLLLLPALLTGCSDAVGKAEAAVETARDTKEAVDQVRDTAGDVKDAVDAVRGTPAPEQEPAPDSEQVEQALEERRTVQVQVPESARGEFEAGANSLIAAVQALVRGVRIDLRETQQPDGGSAYAITVTGDKEQVGKAVTKIGDGVERLARAVGATVSSRADEAN